MGFRRIDWLVIAGLAAGTHYFIVSWLGAHGAWHLAEKGATVSLFALWAALQARGTDGWLIAAVMALGAVGDVTIETYGLTIGALAFLAGHIGAVVLYLRNRRATLELAVPVAVAIAVVAWLLPADRAAATGVAIYALGLGAMTGTALNSRYPRQWVGLGALFFAASDLLIFARLGPLHGSIVPSLLIWPLYYLGQAMIAWGVVTRLRSEH